MMKKSKKITKLITIAMAVTTLTVGSVGISASAVEPRYGGSGTFTVNGVSVNKSIDGYKTTAAGSTSCNSTLCSWVYVSVSGYYNSTQCFSDYNFATRGKASVGFSAESGKEFIRVTSYHSATINGIDGNDDMSVTL